MHGHMNVKYVSDYYLIKVHSYTQVHLLVFFKKKIIHLINLLKPSGFFTYHQV
jgi:hypothetical protein